MASSTKPEQSPIAMKEEVDEEMMEDSGSNDKTIDHQEDLTGEEVLDATTGIRRRTRSDSRKEPSEGATPIVEDLKQVATTCIGK